MRTNGWCSDPRPKCPSTCGGWWRRSLGLPVKAIRVIKPRLGGGFGVKQEMLIEDIVAHLVLATRRPVRLELDSRGGVHRRRAPAMLRRSRSGPASAGEGQLMAQDMRVVANTGAYGTHGFTVQSLTGQRGLSTYNCPAKRFRCDVAYTNRPVAGAFRGYGAPQAFFALESHMDDIAAALGMDPVELRRANWVQTRRPPRHRATPRRARRRRGHRRWRTFRG